MDRYIQALYLFFSFLICSPLFGQSHLCKIERLSIEDGLSNRFVRAIAQDSRGFMWFGTKNGLNRYDGYQFKVFTQQNSAIQSDFIDKIYESPDSNIWIGHAVNTEGTETFSALDIMNIHTFEMERIEEYFGAALPCTVDDIYEIQKHPSNNYLYLTTKIGKVYIYKGNKEFELFYEAETASEIRCLFFGEKYDWIYVDHQLIALNKDQQIIRQQSLVISTKMRCNFIGEASSSRVWLESNETFNIDVICSWDLDSNVVKKQKILKYFDTPIPVLINAEMEWRERAGYYLYHSRGELRLFDENKKQFYYKKFGNNRNFIRTLYVDRNENIWLGIISKGITKISCKKNRFQPYLKGISTRGITSFQNDSLLLVSSYGGRFVIHKETGKKIPIDTLSDLDVIKSRDGKRMFIGSPGRHLTEILVENYKKKKVYPYKEKWQREKRALFGMKIRNIWGLCEDVNERLWIGTSNGLAYKEKNSDSMRVFMDYKDCPELSEAVINFFYENEAGMWMASSIGLYLMNLNNGAIQRYSKEMPAPFQLPYNHIFHIHEDKNKLFWLATRGGGMIKFDPNTGKWEQLTTEHGLCHNVVYATLEDEYGFLWISSDNGLMRFDPKKNTFNTYLKEHGILHEEFNRLSEYQAPDGKLYFGGLGGVVGFDPGDFLNEDKFVAPLKIIRFQYFDGKQSALVDKTNDLIDRQKIVLDYTDRFFLVDVAVLDYMQNEKRQYAYKIEGLDHEWNFIKTNSIRINGLSAGNYQLLIKGEGNDGGWTKVIKIPIQVKQPFYLTWQFFLFLALVIIGLVIFYSRLRVARLYKIQGTLEAEVSRRTQKIEQQANELRELDNVKSRFFANISHELRTPLTLMLGPISAILDQHYGTDLKKREEVLRLVSRNGIKLQQLIEEILVLSKLEAKNIELSERQLILYPLINQSLLAFEGQANLQGIELKLNYNLDENLAVWLDDNKFEKILNNLLSNALKYTPRKGTIVLNVAKRKEDSDQLFLELEVVDSGQGIYPEDLPYIFDRFYQSKHKNAIVEGGTGIGLALSCEFAQLLGGSLSVESELGKGSAFLLSIPFKKTDITAAVLIEETEVEAAAIATINTSANDEQYRVLIVEDNQDMRMFLGDLLGGKYQVLTAENGRVALEVLEKEQDQIDLIISDVMMPEMDGFELLTRIKKHDLWKQLPVIMLTARATEQDKLSALRIGVDDYLAKPFSRQELLIRLSNLLQSYQQRKEWKAAVVVEEEKSAPELASLTIEESKDEWIEELERITKREVGNTQFNIVSLAYNLNISERQLRRRIKTKTGLTPNQYFRAIKLDTARQYLEKKRYGTVAEVAYKVGFSNVHYFTKIYLAQYGKKPIEYLKQ